MGCLQLLSSEGIEENLFAADSFRTRIPCNPDLSSTGCLVSLQLQVQDAERMRYGIKFKIFRRKPSS